MPETEAYPWHVINGQELLDLLKRATSGEDPDLLYLELYANGVKDEDEE